jgi:ABC-type Fe3+/spermidine/putrescine transport system ATPase subunit
MTKDTAPILLVEKLSNRYEGLPFLQEISFALDRGEILCLLGPSGSGKTTLLRLIAGLEKEDRGTVVFDGRDIRDIPPHKRNFGMMFQEYALFPHKSVCQNITFGLEMQHCPPPELAGRLRAVLKMVGLEDLGHRRIDELSGGERQRVALARSLAPEPQLLLLDEPLGSLDRTLRDRLTGEIRAILKKLKMTAIFVTHDQAEAFSVADKVAVLHNGRLQQFDTPEGLYRNPQNVIVAGFLGFTNLIAGSLDEGGIFHSTLGSLPLGNGLGQQKDKVTLLLRPEGAKLIEPQADASDAPRLSGLVTNRIFQGSSYRVTLQSGHQPLTFYLPIDPPPPATGSAIHLALNPAALVLIDEPVRNC